MHITFPDICDVFTRGLIKSLLQKYTVVLHNYNSQFNNLYICNSKWCQKCCQMPIFGLFMPKSRKVPFPVMNFLKCHRMMTYYVNSMAFFLVFKGNIS